MRKPETTFISSVHKHLPLSLHYEKMNNPYRSGTADVWYSDKYDMWVEYKYIDPLPKNVDVIADCSPLQLKWLRERYTEGRRVYVIIGCKLGGVILADRSWEHPIQIEAFKRQIIDRKEVAGWILAQLTGSNDELRISYVNRHLHLRER